jgi:hypothetical protein
MLDDVSKEKVIVIVVISASLLILMFLAGLAYVVFVRPTFGLQYANIFFMVSFAVIFFSLIYLYHIWVTKIQDRGD